MFASRDDALDAVSAHLRGFAPIGRTVTFSVFDVAEQLGVAPEVVVLWSESSDLLADAGYRAAIGVGAPDRLFVHRLV